MSTHGKKKPSFEEIKLRHSNYRVKQISFLDDVIKQPFKLEEDLEEKSLNESENWQFHHNLTYTTSQTWFVLVIL